MAWLNRGPVKTTDLSQVTDKVYHIMLYTSPWSRFEITTSVVIGTDCIDNCKSNYHMITATTAPTVNGYWHFLCRYYTYRWKVFFAQKIYLYIFHIKLYLKKNLASHLFPCFPGIFSVKRRFKLCLHIILCLIFLKCDLYAKFNFVH